MPNNTPAYTTKTIHSSLAAFARTGLNNQLTDRKDNPHEHRESENNGVGELHDDIHNGRYNRDYLSLMQSASVEFTASTPQTRPKIKNDIIGHAPNIGRYIQGHPRSMFKRDTKSANTRALKIAVAINASAITSQEQIANRAAAILSVIEKLESRGIKTHVELFMAVPDKPSTPVCTDCELHTIQIKNHNQKLTLPQLTYLCDARLLRGLGFTYTEASAHNKNRALTDSGYGQPQNFETLTGFDICYPSLFGRTGVHYDTPKKALKEIEALTVAQLSKTQKPN